MTNARQPSPTPSVPKGEAQADATKRLDAPRRGGAREEPRGGAREEPRGAASWKVCPLCGEDFDPRPLGGSATCFSCSTHATCVCSDD